MNRSRIHSSLIVVASLVVIAVLLGVPTTTRAAGGCNVSTLCANYVCGRATVSGNCDDNAWNGCGYGDCMCVGSCGYGEDNFGCVFLAN